MGRNRGYKLEHDVESFLLELADQKREQPVFDRCHRTPTSGAHRGMKGDVISRNVPFFEKQIHIECKRRKELRKDGMIVTVPEAWLIKNNEEALADDRLPFFIGAFTGARSHRMFVVCDKAECINFLNFAPGFPIETFEINKNKRFKIIREPLRIVWEKNLASTFCLKGSTGNSWILFSYEIFQTLLKKKKEKFLNDRQTSGS